MSTNAIEPDARRIQTCGCCGLIQTVGAAPEGMRALCARCGTGLSPRWFASCGNARTTAFALSAIILYPLAVTLPILRIAKFGHHNEASILEGTITLLSSGHITIGIVVLLCSIVLPLGKLAALLVLSAGSFLLRKKHQALTYRVVEFTGRWGMLDVLLVAILVAALKVGDIVEVSPGPAAVAFAGVVVLSLLAAASFDPHSVWPSQSLSECDAQS